jgi:outer membrane protein OmpA-like peptidoglycan-associated protein
MLRIIILTGTVLLLQILSAQSQDPVSDPWLEKSFKKGLRLKKLEQYDKALKQFDRILTRFPENTDAINQRALIFFRRDETEKAIAEWQRLVAIDSSYNASVYYSLGSLLEKQSNRQEAMNAYRTYIRMTGPEEANYQKAEKNIVRLEFVLHAMAHPVDFHPYDPGKNINTPDHEYLATLDITGTMMVFTRRSGHQEDLYISYKKDGSWLPARPIRELNTPYNEGAHSLSPDGRLLYFTACENHRTLGGCDLFVSERTDTGWSAPRNLDKPVNSGSWDSQPVVSADGNLLFFSSTRPGGLGGRDIWYCEKDRSGKWSTPKNAGKPVNTPGNEESPFLHPDGVHLYFMSDGHLGMGGYDLYLSVREADGWKEPVNLGYPINTESDEGAIRVASDGKTAFFSSDRLDLSGQDNKNLNVYAFELPGHLRSLPVGFVEGTVLDRATAKPVRASYRLFDNLSGGWIRDGQTDGYGRFLVALPPGKHYHLSIDHPGYVFFSEQFNLEDVHTAIDPFFLDVRLIPMSGSRDEEQELESQEIVLRNLFFRTGSAELDTIRSAVELAHLVEFLERNPSVTIRIEGHTDNTGSETDNLTLSLDRARVVQDYLIARGIQPGRLECAGYGESRPVDTNTTPEGRQNNRRTSFKIINQ